MGFEILKLAGVWVCVCVCVCVCVYIHIYIRTLMHTAFLSGRVSS